MYTSTHVCMFLCVYVGMCDVCMDMCMSVCSCDGMCVCVYEGMSL